VAFGFSETGSANSPTNRKLSSVTNVMASRFAGSTLFETISAIRISSAFYVSNKLYASVFFHQLSNPYSKQLCGRYQAECHPDSLGSDKPSLTFHQLVR
jgi:hypothetical protein